MHSLIDYFLNIDKYLNIIVQSYGGFVYLILFTVIFCETGLVVTPFLPGDSVIFTCGALAAIGEVNYLALMTFLIAAAILGDTTNYILGKKGATLISKIGGRFIKEKYIKDARSFYDKYGGMAIFLGRFIPVVRTFVPFIAGMSSMKYQKFGFYNIAGGITWVVLFLSIGYYFGNIPLIKENFSLTILAIIFISIIPIFIKYRVDKKTV